MKVLLKLGGSLIAPKNKDGVDHNYLKVFSFFLDRFSDEFMVIHGTGNVGHGRVLNLLNTNPNIDRKTLIKQDYKNGRKILDVFFQQVDNYFNFTRLDLETFLEFPYFKDKTIVGGDALSNGEIISSDDIFQMVLLNSDVDLGLLLTDVDGVLDSDGKVIKKIDNLNSVDFWKKEGDVTGGMKAKVEKLLNLNKRIVICNGYDFENIKNILTTGNGNGTFIS